MPQTEEDKDATDLEEAITRDSSGHERYETEALSKGGDE